MRRSILVFVCILAIFLIGLTTYGKLEAASVRGKAAPRNMLPKELVKLDIKDEFVPSAGKEAGVIQTVNGHVVVAHENMRQAYFATAGDRLYEKDIVFTLKQSRCRFKMHHEDVVTMGENTRVGITSFTDNRKTQEKRSSFSMANGKAMFYTLRLFKHKGAAMEVATPTAVAGVRGTKFGVEVIELDGTTTASLPVLVADLSDAGFMHLAQATQPSFQTNVHTFDGSVAVTSTTTGQTTSLGAGQSLNVGTTGLGNTFATPPSVSQQFQSDTNAGPPAGGGAGGGTPGSGSGSAPAAGGGDTGTTTTTSTTPPDTSTVTQQQSTIKTEDTFTSVPTRPSTHYGYFSGMLTIIFSGNSKYFSNFSMSTTLQNFDSSTITGENPYATGHSVTADGSADYQDFKITKFQTNGYGGNQGVQVQIKHVEIGSNEYMEWGSWTQSTPMATDPSSYSTFDYANKGHYIYGDYTTDAQMLALKNQGLSATYSGNAYGTYYTTTGGVAMGPDVGQGSFSTKINFSTGGLSDFNINVSNTAEGKSVVISNGSGSFTSGTSQFQVTGTGTITGSTGAAATLKAYGSTYGNQAQAIGGVWAARTNPNGAYKYATGIFQGSKQ